MTTSKSKTTSSKSKSSSSGKGKGVTYKADGTPVGTTRAKSSGRFVSTKSGKK
jgi:hypothetical protein